MRAALTYHSIDDSGSAISVAPRVFESHLAWLASGRVRVVSLDALASETPDDGNAIAITFDDGFRNTQAAVSALVHSGLPVTVFVVSRQVGGTNAWSGRSQRGIPTLPLMGWDEIADLQARGATIGAHSRTHRSLTALDSAALADELDGCADDLSSRLGRDPIHVAYPYGEVDTHVAARAAARYRYGHTTAFRPRTTNDAPLALPRLDAYYFRSSQALDGWDTAAFARKIAWIQMRRRLRERLVGGWAPRRDGTIATRPHSG